METVSKDFSLLSLALGTGNFSLNVTFIQAKIKTYLLSWSQSGIKITHHNKKQAPQPLFQTWVLILDFQSCDLK